MGSGKDGGGVGDPIPTSPRIELDIYQTTLNTHEISLRWKKIDLHLYKQNITGSWFQGMKQGAVILRADIRG